MQRPGWYLDELAFAGEEHLDPEYVEIYDRKSATDPSEDIQVLHDLGVDETSVVVDLGAGTGTFALAIAPFCRRVVAAEVAPAMLAKLRERIEREGATNVEPVHAGFLTYEHEGASADVVYSRNALHHLPDFWKVMALRRMHAMLAPGGILRLHDLVYSFEPHETESVFDTWLTGKPERPEEGYTRQDLETHIRTEHSTFNWLLEPMLERVGFEIRDAGHRGGTYSAYTCVRR